MCLGIPMQIVSVDGHTALCSAKGVTRAVSLFLLQDEQLGPGDFVIVHTGHAMQKLTEQEARATWQLLDEMLALDTGGTGPGAS